MSFEKVLIIEDDSVVRSLLNEIFLRRKCSVATAKKLVEAEALIARDSFDLILLDIRLPDGDGEKFLEQLAMLPERPLVIVMTGYGTIESAVACMRAGAFDYVMKPFSPSQIDVIVRKAASYRQLLQVNRLLSDNGGDTDGGLIGRSPAMGRLRQLIERVAPTDATVFISGESGTGKEMMAREIYRRSPRRQQPFIKVNCAAISENLIESEFFGHERGAFTGATERREGRFELANHGTLLLDEISEIPPNLQAKLLRVLQEREFERVGGNRTIKVNVRILATSNRDLLRNVEQGTFRQDLYYRLNVFPVVVPPLRERAEDILVLAEHFLQLYVRKHGIKVTGFAESARRAILTYRWPGNVRELQNTIERAVILSPSGRSVSSAALGLTTSPTYQTEMDWSASLALADGGREGDGAAAEVLEESEAPTAVPLVASNGSVLPIAELEKQAICNALHQTGGNRTQAAAMLGISIRTLRNKLQEYRDANDPLFSSIEAEKAAG
jgi:DNA-binding NtrC family response regulator